METSTITRRAFSSSLAAAGAAVAMQNDWIQLFDGKSLQGWQASENRNTWKVVNGHLINDGPRSHLFYTGAVKNANFRNFELEVEALAAPMCNSGVYFHSRYQENGFPEKGFEVQINNTASGEGTYRERKKTGSLYGVRNVYKQMVGDDEWFRLHIAVRGKNVQVHLNGTLLVDFNEPDPPVIADKEKGRVLNQGTFALQGHDPGSKVRFRSIRVRPLPDDLPLVSDPPKVDDTYRQLLTLGARNYPLVDYHVHLKSGLTLEQVLAKARRDGIQCGLAVNCGKGFPVQDDESAQRFVESLKGQPVHIAMQGEGREWTAMFSRKAVALFDYVFSDSMTWTDNHGKRMRTWIPGEVGTIADPQEFMDTLVDRTVGILDREPIDIYVNPTFIPEVIAKDYDRLWTEDRMKKVIDAAVRNSVAIEINDRYRLPSAAFITMAKAAGSKFSFGTNNGSAADLGRCEYGLQMVEACKLRWQDFFVPAPLGSRAVDRKGAALKA